MGHYTYNINGKILTLTPNANMDYSTPYTVEIPTGGVMNTRGTNLMSPYTFSFTTQGHGGGGSSSSTVETPPDVVNIPAGA